MDLRWVPPRVRVCQTNILVCLGPEWHMWTERKRKGVVMPAHLVHGTLFGSTGVGVAAQARGACVLLVGHTHMHNTQ